MNTVILVESALPPDVLDEAASRLRQIAQANGDLPAGYDRKSPELAQWAKDEIAATFDRLSQLFHNYTILVWREITAPVDWQPMAQHPGIYWTWDRDAAYAAHGDRLGNERSGERVPWLLSAEVTFDQINWVDTLAQNATPSYAGEKEIRIERDAHVTLASYEQLAF